MKVRLVFVLPGGGEADYSLEFELPSVPQPGDYISIMRPDEMGTADFRVRRTWWLLEHPTSAQTAGAIAGTQPVGKLRHPLGLTVECEFAKGPHSSDSHQQTCETYKNRKGQLVEFEDTAY